VGKMRQEDHKSRQLWAGHSGSTAGMALILSERRHYLRCRTANTPSNLPITIKVQCRPHQRRPHQPVGHSIRNNDPVAVRLQFFQLSGGLLRKTLKPIPSDSGPATEHLQTARNRIRGQHPKRTNPLWKGMLRDCIKPINRVGPSGQRCSRPTYLSVKKEPFKPPFMNNI
jgi:hypothetical protein